jgi:hypothetical protein
MFDKKILYYVTCISAFSKEKGISKREAFNYLYQYKSIEFLIDCYEAEHTLSFANVVEDLTILCKNNGGNIE